MWVILIYDISTADEEGQKRLTKARKIARRYLHHIQKSVFEGEITLSKLEKLKSEIQEVINDELDSVVIYVFHDLVKYDRLIFGVDIEDRSSNII